MVRGLLGSINYILLYKSKTQVIAVGSTRRVTK